MKLPNCSHPLLHTNFNASEEQILTFLEDEEYKHFHPKIPALVIYVFFFCVGIPGNIIVILVYKFRFESSTTKTFILALAFVDLSNCAVGIPFNIYQLRHPFFFKHFLLCKALLSFFTFCAATSNLTLVAIAVDRYRRICQPFKRQMTVKQSKYIVIAFALFSFCLSIPSFIYYGQKTETIIKGVVVESCGVQNFWINTLLYKAHQILMLGIWIGIIVSLCSFYAQIFIKINRHEKRFNTSIVNPTNSIKISQVKTSLRKTSPVNPEGNILTIGNQGVTEFTSERKSIFIRLFKKDIDDEETSDEISDISQIWDSGVDDIIETENRIELPSKVVSKMTSSVDPKAEERRYSEILEYESSQLAIQKEKPIIRELTKENETDKKLHKKTAQFSCDTKRQIKASKIAVMMFNVTIANMCSYLPHFILRICMLLNSDSMEVALCSAGYVAFHYILTSLVVLNQSINPLIYSRCNKQFREKCLELKRSPISFCHNK